ncbi:MAG: TIGR02466 family protein [Steroidobacteraceae bacterium]
MRALFPTLVYTGRLRTGGARGLNARLLRECRQLRDDDAAGRRWSQRNYPGGYTSYASANRMHRNSPTFAALARELDRHVARFARALRFDLARRPLAMTDCWVNLMGAGAVHGLHLHPLSTLSGTYYVATPAGSPGLKLEDPRLERFMAAPPRSGASHGNHPWVTLRARRGQLVLFESWLRHEVPVHRTAAERVSISFNYSWF